MRLFHKILTGLAAILVLLYILVAAATYYGVKELAEESRRKPVKTTSEDAVKPDSLKKGNSTPPEPMEEHGPEAAEPSAEDRATAETLAFLDQLHRIEEIRNSQNAPPLCDLLCRPAVFESGPKEKTLQNFSDFFEKEQNRAFEDFDFRWMLDYSLNTMRIIPPYAVDFVKAAQNLDRLSVPEKLYLGAVAPVLVTRMLAHLDAIKDETKAREKVLKDLHRLRRRCEKEAYGLLVTQCRAITGNDPLSF